MKNKSQLQTVSDAADDFEDAVDRAFDDTDLIDEVGATLKRFYDRIGLNPDGVEFVHVDELLGIASRAMAKHLKKVHSSEL